MDTVTILIVDDDPSVRGVIMEWIKRFNRCWVPVESLDEKRATTLCAYSDIAIVDVVMPHVDAAKLADKMRKANPNLKVLFLTGYGDERAHQEFKVPRDEHVLAKPFKSSQLKEAIEKLLKKQRR